MGQRNYYLCQFLFDGQRPYVIWASNNTDELIRLSNGKIATFRDESGAAEFCRVAGISLMAEPAVVYDFDRIAAWCTNAAIRDIDPAAFLNAWNMLDDAHSFKSGVRSLHEHSLSEAGYVYDKLFWANNLPSVTPIGTHYDPAWSEEDMKQMSHIFRLGLAELRASIAMS
ncbi:MULTISPECIES: hypothetical protein [unclassified Bradyrhizobium]|uniref:hypothetical protein n=1 Tax=unclassified Bradyrhizobium TaxID=2631580 RepID=UPI0028EEC03C|nr:MULTISPECIES: hypothetical protein [unclassified Bradyrhizobium]